MPEHENLGEAELRERERLRDAGASLVEYALMVAVVIVALIGAVQFLGTNSEQRYESRWGSTGLEQYDDYNG